MAEVEDCGVRVLAFAGAKGDFTPTTAHVTREAHHLNHAGAGCTTLSQAA